jgi:integrase
MNSFVFWADKMADKPAEQDIFLDGLREALQRAGMTDDGAKSYCFHAWRHYFTAYMREQVNEKLLQRQTGHKTPAMLDHYSDHHIAGERESIQQAQQATFGRLLGSITRQDIEDFTAYLEARPEQRATSATRKNLILRAGTIPLKWAAAKEYMDRDITAGLVWYAGKAKERPILTPELAEAAFRVNWIDERSRLANMLAMVTGMRAGELQGLRVQDLGRDCLYVRHSWNFQDGLKPPKNNEERTVELPFPGIVSSLLELSKNNPHGVTMNSFVFWADKMADKPAEQDIFLDGLREALQAAGMTEAGAKVYTFHAWRHYFTAYMRDQLNEKLLRRQTGHKTPAMLEHYSDHRIAGERESIQQAQRAAFGRFLPMDLDGGGGAAVSVSEVGGAA